MEVVTTRWVAVDAAEAERIPKGGVGGDAPNYVDGKRGRAPAQGAKDSDIPAQFLDKT